jgi:ornithine cyclodeaminase/alanine dehydrogenase-like protein (mu-crystallin family)
VSSEPRLIGADELRARLPMAAAIDVLEAAFRTLDAGAGPLRSSVETPGGSLLLMPAFGEAGVGVKLVTLTPSNPARGMPYVQASYVLFDAATQTPEAVLDGSALTALRTGAVSGLATRHLAREDAARLLIFGAGVQARAHLEAMCSVRPVRELVVVSRSRPAAESLVGDGLRRGLVARLGDPEAVADADLICTCTTSEEPLFDGSLLRPGVHVNAIGSHRPDARELDTETVRRGRVVVETRDVALAEAGELAIPIAEGAIDPGHVLADLAETVRGAAVRGSPEDVTVFKGVGMAFEDLTIARAIVDAPAP